MITLDRLELWTGCIGQSGAAFVAHVPFIGVDGAITESLEGLVWVPRLSLTIPTKWTSVDELIGGRVFRLFWNDATIEEFRIADDGIDVTAGSVAVQAGGIILDLSAYTSVLTETEATVVSLAVGRTNETPSDTLTALLALGPAWFAVGSVTPTTNQDVTLSASTPLNGAIATATVANEREQVQYELWASLTGSPPTGYLLNLTVRNESAVVPEIRLGKNIRSLRRNRTTRTQFTRAVVNGENGVSGVSRAYHYISAISANTYIEVKDLIGGPGVAREADQWNTPHRWVELKNGTVHEITDTVVVDAQTTRLHMASTASMVVDEVGFIAADASGNDLVLVESPSLKATWGVRLGLLDLGTERMNLFRNPDLRDWSGTYPDKWTGTGTGITVDTTAGNHLHGGQSAKWSASLAGRLRIAVPVRLLVGWSLAITVWMKIQAYTTFTDVNGSITFNGTMHLLDGSDSGFNSLSEWFSYTHVVGPQLGVATNLTADQVDLNQATSGNGIWWLDSAELQLLPPGVSATAGRSVPPADFTRGVGAARRLATVNKLFETNGAPITSYQLQVADLARLDSGRWPYDTLVPGGSANIVYQDAATPDSQRLVSYTRQLFDPLKSEVTFATRRPGLTQLIG